MKHKETLPHMRINKYKENNEYKENKEGKDYEKDT